ncbi:rhodanese-like domain-containing protein [Salipaludibacillus agaradhaerens]|jgi:rhodanese-related sulfurtransferase|uniref:Rhodanese-like domain-containing protein n=1 Tax=Salipaludibacillus agaradhaerens TaxID=76935 RepID=A0A9Q4FXW1_SALAG|nr:rhodanese-like domain-containing protein [Salipaludibacillus agaradhaerens]MCR6095731.1 rhodanese-like domain-containing protein [Salipaludibacillus agaradhaerens]MCR6114709.1 rhodanese-like domain-containing protein [Salipaludibacillus agaradhaerens]
MSTHEKDGIKQIDKESLKDLLSKGDPKQIVLDVREPDEYVSGHIPGVPLIPMHSIPNLLDGFDKNKEYVFVCRSGNRSQNVSLFMKEQGFNNVMNYDGGMLAWDGDTNEGEETYIKSPEDLKKL